MNEAQAAQRVLQKKLQDMQSRNPAYSVRALARKLAIAPSTLSMLLNGQRKASRKMIEKIADGLGLDPYERSRLIETIARARDSVASNEANRATPAGMDFLKLAADQFHVLSDWYYFGILNLLQTADFESEPEWIARRLGLANSTVIGALDRLKRLGMIREAEDGRLERATPPLRTEDDVANSAVRKSHHQGIELARESLDRDPLEERDFTWYVSAIDPEQLPAAKKLIRKFQDELFALLKSGERRTEVYRLNMQLFPLTRKKEVK